MHRLKKALEKLRKAIGTGVTSAMLALTVLGEPSAPEVTAVHVTRAPLTRRRLTGQCTL